MSQTLEDLQELFAEGVQYVTSERWVSLDEIEDARFRALYKDVLDAHEAYYNACDVFQGALDE